MLCCLLGFRTSWRGTPHMGSQVTLYCSFWSSEWVSDDLSFTWRYQPEGGRDAISVSAGGILGLRNRQGASDNHRKENLG